MTIVAKKDRIGASRAKLALVGVLAVALVVVVGMQWSGSADIDVATASVAEMPGWEGQEHAANPVSNPLEAKTEIAEKSPRVWPEMSLEEIVVSDPLAAPPWYLSALETEDSNAEAAAGNSLVLAEMQQVGTTIVLIAGGQRIATIGDRQIRIGDRIEGYQVSDITDEGVILTKSRPR